MKPKKVIVAPGVWDYLKECPPNERREFQRIKRSLEVNPVENTSPFGIAPWGLRIVGYTIRTFEFGRHVAVCTYDLVNGIVYIRECRWVRVVQ